MTINSIEDIFKDAKFYFYTGITNKKTNTPLNFDILKEFKRPYYDNYTFAEYILSNGKACYEWWIELDPKVIEEVNREFDLSK